MTAFVRISLSVTPFAVTATFLVRSPNVVGVDPPAFFGMVDVLLPDELELPQAAMRRTTAIPRIKIRARMFVSPCEARMAEFMWT